MAARLIEGIDRQRAVVAPAALVLFAFVLRLCVLFVAGVNAQGNTYEHGEIAKNLLAGRGFAVRYLGVEGPTSQQAPLYPALLAAASFFNGDVDHTGVIVVEVLQAAAGAGIALAVAVLGLALFPTQRAIGWTAGWLAAVFPSHLYMATQIQVVVWAALLLTSLIVLAVRAPGRSPNQHALLLGLVGGLLLLVEPILVLALPVVAIEYWRRARDGAAWLTPTPLLRTLLLTATVLVVIAPWLIRNYRVHGEPVFIKSSFGYAFWQGNNEASWGTDKVPKAGVEQLRVAHDGTPAGINRALWEARHETVYIDDLLLQTGGYREFQGLSEPARSRLLQDRAWAAIRHDPGRYWRLCGQRLRYFLLFDETNPKAGNRLYRAMTVVWLVLAILGLSVTRARWRELWPTYAIFVLVMLFHTLTITSARFRMPLEPFTLVWCAAGIAPLGARLWTEARAGLALLTRKLRRPAVADGDGSVPRLAPPVPHIPLRAGKRHSAASSHVTHKVGER